MGIASDYATPYPPWRILLGMWSNFAMPYPPRRLLQGMEKDFATPYPPERLLQGMWSNFAMPYPPWRIFLGMWSNFAMPYPPERLLLGMEKDFVMPYPPQAIFSVTFYRYSIVYSVIPCPISFLATSFIPQCSYLITFFSLSVSRTHGQARSLACAKGTSNTFFMNPFP